MTQKKPLTVTLGPPALKKKSTFDDPNTVAINIPNDRFDVEQVLDDASPDQDAGAARCRGIMLDAISENAEHLPTYNDGRITSFIITNGVLFAITNSNGCYVVTDSRDEVRALAQALDEVQAASRISPVSQHPAWEKTMSEYRENNVDEGDLEMFDRNVAYAATFDKPLL